MGCGKSKHADVAGGNTVLKRKTSTIQSEKRKEIKTEIMKNNIDEVVISGMVKKESEIVKEVGSYNNVKDKVENEPVQEEKVLEKSKENGSMMEKKEETISEQKFEKVEDGKDDSLIKENEQILGEAIAEVKKPTAEENKAISEDFEAQKDDSLTNSNQEVNVSVEEKGSPEENIVMAEVSEGEKEESSEKNDEKVNNAELEEEKKTKYSDNFESGKGNSLEENSQQVNDDATDVKEPEEEEREENVTGVQKDEI